MASEIMRRSSKLDNGGAIKFVSKRGQGHGEGGIRVWFAGNFTNSIMRIRLLTRLSNASVRISRVLEKKKFFDFRKRTIIGTSQP